MHDAGSFDPLKDLCRLLYTQQKASVYNIAQQTNLPESTILDWIDTDGWNALRLVHATSGKAQLLQLYNLTGLLYEKLENAGSDLSAKDVDALIKYTALIKSLENGVSTSDIIDVAALFVQWLREIDLALTQKITPHLDAFIRQRLDPLSSIS